MKKTILFLLGVALYSTSAFGQFYIQGTVGSSTSSSTTTTASTFAQGTAIRSYTTRDDFNDVDANYALGATVTSLISGSLVTWSDSASTTFNRRNRQFHVVQGNLRGGLKTTTTFTHTAGTTFVSTVTLNGGTASSIRNGYMSTANGPVADGIGIGYLDSTHKGAVYALVGGTAYNLYNDVVKLGETYSTAIRMTSGGWEVWIQGGYFERYGATLGSGSWIRIYTALSTIAGTLSGSTSGTFGAGSDFVFSEVALTSDFQPRDATVKILDEDQTLQDTHEGSVVYDRAGNLWCGWVKTDVDDGASSTPRVAVRLPNGTWSATTTIYTSSGVNRENLAFLSLVNGEIWCVTNTTTDGFATVRIPKKRVLTVNSSGVITVGSATTFGGLSGLRYNYTPIYTTATGALLMPFHDTIQWWTARSTDGGTTWTDGTKYSVSTGLEPTVATEADGTLACYTRVPVATSAYVPRFVSADDGISWTSSGVLTGVPSNNSRYQAIQLPNGNTMIVGCDTSTDYVRSFATAWEIGIGGTVVSKIPLTILNSGYQNYPSVAVNGDKMAAVIPSRASVAGIPGVVIFSEQTLSTWGKTPLTPLTDVATNATLASYAPLASPVLTGTPNIAAATGTSLDLAATAGNQKLLLYNSGNNKYGFGILSGVMQNEISSTGVAWAWSTISASDGTTLAEKMRLSVAGGLSLGSATDPGVGNLSILNNVATTAAAPTIASAATIAPTKMITFISGTAAIATITAPPGITAAGGTITLIPTGIFTTTTAGNIALASTAVVSKPMTMTYDVTTVKWYPSY